MDSARWIDVSDSLFTTTLVGIFRRRPRDRRVLYFAGAAGLLFLYLILSAVLLRSQDFSPNGPLALSNPPLTAALPGAQSLPAALDSCFPKDQRSADYAYKIVGGFVLGQPYYACYQVSRSSGSVFNVVVIGADGTPTTEPAILKAGGAWPWAGVIKSGQDLAFGGIGVATVLFFGWLYYYRSRPGAPLGERWYRQHWLLVFVSSTWIGLLALAFWPHVSRARKIRTVLEMFFIVGATIVVFPLLLGATRQDTWAEAVGVVLVLTLFWSVVGGRKLLAPVGFGAPEATTPTSTRAGSGSAMQPAEIAPSGPSVGPLFSGTSVPRAAPAGLIPGGQPAPRPVGTPPSDARPNFPIKAPESLPSFAVVGGMTGLKKELQDTIGLMLAYPDKADEYRIDWNGILLYGPPGVGKTFIASATAGEFGLNFLPVPAAGIASSLRGESPRNVVQAFQTAVQNLPCVLFFDEFDGIAQRRDDFPDQEARRTVDQLLQSLEQYRAIRELIVMAATNDIGTLDPAVIRAGRFDRHIRVDLPDAEARRAILSVQLSRRPVADDIDLDDLARRAEGRSAASIAQAVEQAALDAFQRASQTGQTGNIGRQDLVTAISKMGGKDRPTVENWTWDSLILPSAVKLELQELVAVVKDPDVARAYGVEPPTGLLLTGPPGTGKTTIAKVIAAQSSCSFYPISGSDVTSKWVGESEQNIARLFQRARENQPSIIFFDEIDAIASRRGDWGTYDQQINQLLQEIDGMSGQKGVFVIGATNRPDKLDPAITRGGRLSRTISIPAPTRENRLEMLKLFTAQMPLADVNLAPLADRTDGLAGADIKAMCQQAGLIAMMRHANGGQVAGAANVTQADFEQAIVQQAGTVGQPGPAAPGEA
jgi:transitional endoplasmic reticulum ATPase